MKRGVYNNVLEAIGNTPLVKLNKIINGFAGEVYVKLEAANPGGSIKDRIAPFIIADAEKSGRLKPGGTIVEATSGNTGIGLAMAAITKGYKCVAVMSDKQSMDKVNILKSYGVDVVMCPAEVEPEDPRSYYKVAERLSREIPNAVLGNQYNNMANTEAHYRTTGPEIWDQLDGKVDYYLAGVGTGGTISGTSKFLKEKNGKLMTIGVDPKGSILKEYHETGKIGKAHSYLIEGMGEDFLPANVCFPLIDKFVQVTDQEAITAMHRLVREEGIFCGASGGAAIAGMIKILPELKPGRMVVILPDNGTKYIGKFYNAEWLKSKGIQVEGFTH